MSAFWRIGEGGDGALSPDAACALHRDCRIAVAAVALALFPALALTAAEPIGVVAALLLAGVLPAAVALDLRRPDDLPRALAMGLLAAAIVLLGAVLKGLPAISALALLAIAAIEAVALGGRAAGRPACAILALFALLSAGVAVRSEASQPASLGAAAAVALMLVANVLTLVAGMIRAGGRERRRDSDRHLRAGEIEAVLSEAVVAVDRSGAVLRATGSERILGLPSDALLGRGLAELALVADRPELLTALCDAAHGGPERRLRLRLRDSIDGATPRYRWVEARVAPSAEAGVAAAALRDVTRLVAEEDERAIAAGEAEAGQRARAAFLATVNHELRTPLNAIIGFSEILANRAAAPPNPERLREYAGLINGAGRDLLRIVTTMIDITRLDSGVYEFEPEPADLRLAVEAAVEAFRHEPEAEGAVLVVQAPAEPIEADIDPRAFRQALHQLLSNAVKFGGAAGPIVVAVRTEADGAAVALSDRGPGVPPEMLAQIGRRFARLDEPLSREHGGVGLGLSLACGIVALHAGRLGIESAAGRGTTVTVRLGERQRPSAGPNIHPLPARRDRPADASEAAPAKDRLRA